MAIKKFERVPEDETEELTSENFIYADKISNFLISSTVTKLTFSINVAPKKNRPTATIVIPTDDFIRSIEFILDQCHNNKELISKLIDDKNSFNELLESPKKRKLVKSTT